MKRLDLALGALLIFVTAGKCGAPDSQPSSQPPASGNQKELVLTEESDGKTVSAGIGQKVVIRIPSEGAGPKPPPQWTAKLEGDSLKQQGEILLHPKTITGPGGIVGVQQGGRMTAEAIFSAAKAGKTVVTIESRPRGQPQAKPSKTVTVTVDVQARRSDPAGARPATHARSANRS